MHLCGEEFMVVLLTIPTLKLVVEKCKACLKTFTRRWRAYKPEAPIEGYSWHNWHLYHEDAGGDLHYFDEPGGG